MAHFRRRRPRTSTRAKMYSETGWRKRHNLQPIKIPDGPSDYSEWMPWHRSWRNHFWPPDAPSQMDNWPRWFDVVFHTRPQRRRTKAMEQKILSGRLDPDNTAWPLSKKPLVYYW